MYREIGRQAYSPTDSSKKGLKRLRSRAQVGTAEKLDEERLFPAKTS